MMIEQPIPLKRARYSEVERRLWNDDRFRNRLSPIPPSGQGLWLYMLTTPELGALPGLIVMGEAAMAEHLGWPVEAFRKAFAEVHAQGMADADWKARVVVTWGEIKKQRPQSPNVVRSWHQFWLDVPDCSLKVEYYRVLKAFVEGLGEAFRKAFAEAIADPSPNHKHDHKHDHEEENKQPSIAGSNEPAVGGTNGGECHAEEPGAVVDETGGHPSPANEPEFQLVAETGPGPDDVELVFMHYLASWKHAIGGTRPPALTPQRRRMLRKRLRDFSTDELKRAVDGLFSSDFNLGANERGKRYVYPELLFRSSEQVEKYLVDAPTPEPDVELPPAFEPPNIPGEELEAQRQRALELAQAMRRVATRVVSA